MSPTVSIMLEPLGQMDVDVGATAVVSPASTAAVSASGLPNELNCPPGAGPAWLSSDDSALPTCTVEPRLLQVESMLLRLEVVVCGESLSYSPSSTVSDTASTCMQTPPAVRETLASDNIKVHTVGMSNPAGLHWH